MFHCNALTAAAACGLVAFAPLAGALTTSFSGGTLSISTAAGETAAVTAVGGFVKINGADPGTGAASASAVTQINAVLSGSGSQAVDYSAVTSGDFPALTKTSTTVSAATNAVTGWSGLDEIYINLSGQPFDFNHSLTKVGPNLVYSATGIFNYSATFTGTESLSFLLGDGDDTFTIGSLLGLAALSVSAGQGNDTVTANVQATPCAIDLQGGGGVDVLEVNVGGFVHTQFADHIDISSKASVGHGNMETVNVTNTGTDTRVDEWGLLED